jgi:hypothetical protein
MENDRPLKKRKSNRAKSVPINTNTNAELSFERDGIIYILHEILKFVPPKELMVLKRVCKTWKQTIESKHLTVDIHLWNDACAECNSDYINMCFQYMRTHNDEKSRSLRNMLHVNFTLNNAIMHYSTDIKKKQLMVLFLSQREFVCTMNGYYAFNIQNAVLESPDLIDLAPIWWCTKKFIETFLGNYYIIYKSITSTHSPKALSKPYFAVKDKLLKKKLIELTAYGLQYIEHRPNTTL